MSDSKEGQIEISPKVAARKNDKEFILLHVPTDQYVVLHDIGQKIWEKIENGVTDITQLVAQHAKDEDLLLEVAAFQIISFLDELRAQGFVNFKLERERDSAPLLDTPLSELSPQILKQVTEKTLKADGIERGVILLDSPRSDLTLRDVRQIAESISEEEISSFHRAIVLNSARSDLSLRDVKKIIDKPLETELPDVKRVAILDSPKSKFSLKEIGALAPPILEGGNTTSAARIIIIIIITSGPIIIVVINDGGTGPSSGKSRSACKTMCV